jgi:hypothetical protein
MRHLVDAADASLQRAHADAEDHARRVAELVSAQEPAEPVAVREAV